MKSTVNIEKIYDAMSIRLYNTSLRIVGSRDDAEEIMHDTLLQYWQYSRKHEIQDLKKWLTSVCIRKSIDLLRKRHKWKNFLETYEDPVMEVNDEAEVEFDPGTILKALSGLPDHYRTILSLHLFEGYDYQEISQITGTNEGTIRSQYLRGRQKLAKALKQTKS